MAQQFTASTDGQNVAIAAGVDPTYTVRVRGVNWRPDAFLVLDSIAELRATQYADADTYMVRGIGEFSWSATESGADDGVTIVRPTGVTTGAYVARGGSTILAHLTDGTSVAASGVATEGAASAIPSTPIVAASGSNVLWSRAVAADEVVSATVHSRTTGSGGKYWIGYLEAVVHRVGSGAAAFITNDQGVPWAVNPTALDPKFALNGNALELQITADTLVNIVPKATIQITVTSTANDPVPLLSAAKALVLADAPLQLFYADTELTPSAPDIGEQVTAWGDQSGNAYDANVAFQGGVATYYERLGYAALSCAAAGTVLMWAATTPIPSNGSHAVYWAGEQIANATPSVDILLSCGDSGVLILMHCAPTSLAVGTHITFYTTGGGTYDLGACPDGWHDYVLLLDKPNTTAKFYIDGVLSATVSYADTGTPNSHWHVGHGAVYPVNFRLGGFAYKQSAGSATTAQHWHDMAVLAWGAHD